MRSFRRAGSSTEWSQAAWDEAMLRLNGHLLQSWRWGAFKALHGWSVERVAVGGDPPAAMAQILFARRGPLKIGFIPRGPVHAPGDADSVRALFAQIDRLCSQRGAVFLIAEPNAPLPFAHRIESEGFVLSPERVLPGRTVKIPLLADEALLGQMRPKTRYSVRLAERRGVVTNWADERGIGDFYRLLRDTSTRNQFGIHSEAYYRDFLRTFGEDALLLFATIDGEHAAGVIAARFGEEAIYLYGGSSTEHRAHGAAFALQFEAMRWARDRGSNTYDLWGIPLQDPVPSDQGAALVPGSTGDDWRGLYKFKTGFGGEIVSYPPALERRFSPLFSFVARQAKSLLK
jgi:lipid II:glycine glycyltransferase (peptidoglycan interpeptide bridge formation enzyme)